MKCNVSHGKKSNCLLAAGAQQHQSHLENSLLIQRIRSCYYVLSACLSHESACWMSSTSQIGICRSDQKEKQGRQADCVKIDCNYEEAGEGTIAITIDGHTHAHTHSLLYLLNVIKPLLNPRHSKWL